jgi:exodeoxyribonuclease VII large subunit
MKIFTVEELNTSLKDIVVQQFNYPITIKGEISNVRMPQSGHQYFKLTDNDGFNKHSIDCVIWKGRLEKTAKDYDTQEVLITGNVTMYKATANCQIQVNDITEYGEGALRKAMEETRVKLEKEGLFDNKKEFPLYPSNIGIITSADSHALHDVLSKLETRYPLANITIYPSLVQGVNAAKNIILQLQNCNSEKGIDAIMLIRGGGSLEDLMAFNNEDLAREIYKSKKPIVTGIGHQPDVTIADYVADAAMETPTAAAVFITPDKYELMERFIAFDEKIKNISLIKLNKFKDDHLTIINRINKYNPANVIDNLKVKHRELFKQFSSYIKIIYNEKISIVDLSLKRFHQSKNILKNKYADGVKSIMETTRNLDKRIKTIYRDKFNEHRANHKELLTTDPASALRKGYSIIRDSSGIILKKKSQVHDNQILSAEFKDGYVDIQKVTPKK